MLVMVNGAPVLTNERLPPLVLVELKLETALAPFNTYPPIEDRLRVEPLIKPPPASVIELLAVSEILLLAPAAIEPVMLIAPVLLTVTLPVPDCETPVIVNGAAV